MSKPPPLVFGVFPLGISGGPDGVVIGPPDDFGRIGEALQDLAGDGPPLLVRVYVTFEGSIASALDQAAQFAQIGSVVDLCLSFHDRDGGVEPWCSFVEQVVREHGSAVGSIGITNEANLSTVPFAPDGAYPRALEALVDGFLAAAAPKREVGATAALGFTAAGDADSPTDADRFWRAVAQRGGEAFATALDFAGLTIYPGGFDSRPMSTSELARRTITLLTVFRTQLSTARISASVPIRVSECGWPTGPGRTDADQAEALSAILDAVSSVRAELGVTHWELFTLRDANSSGPDLFGHFGVLRDDYSPKPAYATLRTLIRPGQV
ncbi:MAG: hypothetical protein ACRDGQ_13220 [Candidatus Limnocylindrales bacterium]